MSYDDIEAKSLGVREEDGKIGPTGMARAWHTHLASLKAIYHRLVAGGAVPDPRIEVLLDPKQSDHDSNATNWAIPNEIEVLLVRLYPEKEAEAELKRALAKAEEIGVRSLEAMKAEAAAAATLEEKHAVLATLLRDTHSRYATRRSERVARRIAAWRLARIGFALTAIIAGTLVAIAWGWWTETLLIENHIVVTIFFGFLGAYLSRLIAFQHTSATLNFDDLEAGYAWHFIAVRLLVGGLSSVIVYLIIAGNLIAGELFPVPAVGERGGFGALWMRYDIGEGGSVYAGPSPNFAKLIVWCFIAGFSERFLPDRLGALESQSKSS